MIQLPKRSVTRFFIPLIDVLILLFCIFMLMPMVKSSGDVSPDEEAQIAANPTGPLDQQERAELRQFRQDVQQAKNRVALTEAQREEVARLRQEGIDVLEQRLAIRIWEIDADTGKLYYYGPEPVDIATEADARGLVQRLKRETAGRELYVLLMFPRKLTGFPEEKQVRDYDRWLGGVAHGIDNPRGSR